MKKRIATILAGLLLAVGISSAVPTPEAEAAYPYLELCNSKDSRGPIEVFSNQFPNGWVMYKDECAFFANQNNNVRVDPDPEIGPDVGSTRWAYDWQTGYPSGQCHNGETRIDPPNYYEDEIYYNTDAGGC